MVVVHTQFPRYVIAARQLLTLPSVGAELTTL